MTFTKEEQTKIMGVLKQIDKYTHTIPLEEEFYIKSPFGDWNFKIETDRVYENGEVICKVARIILENSKFLPSCLERVIEKNETYYFPNEIENLIKNWNYIKGEILEESKKQMERKQNLNISLDNFRI